MTPPPAYLAFYAWIRESFEAHAVIHFGKHGNLEWLPGRSVALGADDFPQAVLGALPNLYPFIVNDPGEGTQAKRRTSAVIIDHLTPPLTRAGLYDDLDRMERLLEEHAHSETLYPERARELEHEIEHLLEEAPWKEELPKEDANGTPTIHAFALFVEKFFAFARVKSIICVLVFARDLKREKWVSFFFLSFWCKRKRGKKSKKTKIDFDLFLFPRKDDNEEVFRREYLVHDS